VKKPFALLAPVALFAAATLSGDAANAEDLTFLQGLKTFRFYATVVEGSVTFAASSASSQLAGMSCGDVVVVATSTGMTHPQGVALPLPTPLWTRTTTSTGTFSSGACKYALPVPAGSPFTLTAYGQGKFNCSYIPSNANPTASVTVPKDTTKTVAVDAKAFSCENLQ